MKKLLLLLLLSTTMGFAQEFCNVTKNGVTYKYDGAIASINGEIYTYVSLTDGHIMTLARRFSCDAWTQSTYTPFHGDFTTHTWRNDNSIYRFTWSTHLNNLQIFNDATDADGAIIDSAPILVVQTEETPEDGRLYAINYINNLN